VHSHLALERATGVPRASIMRFVRGICPSGWTRPRSWPRSSGWSCGLPKRRCSVQGHG